VFKYEQLIPKKTFLLSKILVSIVPKLLVSISMFYLKMRLRQYWPVFWIVKILKRKDTDKQTCMSVGTPGGEHVYATEQSPV
jgi:hypothetical protein